MEELLELKKLLHQGDVESALVVVDELEEMGKKGIARNIRSFAIILLLHLIKQQVEKRTTKSWDASIRNCIREIRDINARPKGKGYYLDDEELASAIASAWDNAVDRAALEAAEGIYDSRTIEEMVDKAELLCIAYKLISALN